MTHRERRIVRNYQEFKNRLGNDNIAAYFQINHSSYSLSQLEPSVFKFIIQQETYPKFILDDLPVELSIKIIGFLFVRTRVMYHIQYPIDYPFKPTKWVMKTILPPKLYMDALYVLMHQYDDSWSPAINIETDILNMIYSIEQRRDLTK